MVIFIGEQQDRGHSLNHRSPQAVVIRRYSALPELNPRSRRFPPPAPLDTMARLAAAGVRLADDGRFLLAEVPAAVVAGPAWPRLDRLLARHAPWLADAAALIAVVKRRWTLEEVTAYLGGLRPGMTELAVEIVGGRAELERLLAGQGVAGADLDLLCFAYAEVRLVEAVLSELDGGGRRDAEGPPGEPSPCS